MSEQRTTTLALVLTPRMGTTLAMGYPEKYGSPENARSVSWAAHRDALIDAFDLLAREGLNPTETLYDVTELVGGGDMPYYRAVVTLDYAEALECLRTDGRSVGSMIAALDRAAKAEAEPAKESAAAERLRREVFGEPAAVSADDLVKAADYAAAVELTPADAPLEADTPPAVSFPDAVPGVRPGGWADLMLTILSLPRKRCGRPDCRACHPKAVSADGDRPNGVGRG